MAVKLVHRLMQDRAAGLSPTTAQLLDDAATALTRSELNAAEANLLDVLAQAPDCVEAQRLRGLVMHLRGDYAQAVLMLRQALALSPEHALIHMNLGISLHAGGEPDAALAPLQRACKLAADFAPAWFNLGRVLSMQGRPGRCGYRAAPRAGYRSGSYCGAGHVGGGTDPARCAGSGERELPRGVASTARSCGRVDRPVEPAGGAFRQGRRRPGCSRPCRRRRRRRRVCRWASPCARALEDQADYHAAFRTLYKANTQKRRLVSWNAAAARAKGQRDVRGVRRTVA